jgi:PAS domain-containing protein
MQARLDSLHERMHAIFETLPDAIWSMSLPEAKLTISPAAYGVLGRRPRNCRGPDLRRKIVHPGDLARVEQAWAALRAGKPCEIEYRIVLPDESVRWIRSARNMYARGGVPVRIDGIPATSPSGSASASAGAARADSRVARRHECGDRASARSQ